MIRYSKKYSSLLILLLFAMAAVAQRPAYGKMSSLVREACLYAQANTGVHAAKGNRMVKTPLLTAFVKTSQPDDLSLSGCKVLARYGNLYIVSIPIDKIETLANNHSVQRIEAGRRATAMMDTTNTIIRSDVLHEGINLPQAYKGNGVVVGVQDIGFDLTHPTFFSQDMRRYRIKALWDQLSEDTIGSRLPVGRDYRDSVSLLTIGHPRDGLIQSHGTHTAGIAAGSGSEGGAISKYIGVAPEADICLVCNATSNDADLVKPEDQYKYTYALDALGFKYIFDYADSVGKPCVINFSEGSSEDFRGDDLLYYEMLDSLTGPGHIIVASSGNEGRQLNYLHKPLGYEEAEVNAAGEWHQKVMSFTTLSTNDFTLRLTCGNIVKDVALQDIVQSADSTFKDSIMLDGVKYRLVATAYPDCYDHSRIATDWVVSSDNYITNTFLLQLLGIDAEVELYRGSATFSNILHNSKTSNLKFQTSNLKSQTSSQVADNTHSILSPGSAPSVICVGMTGYRTTFLNYRDSLMDFGGSRDGEIQINSSVGPTYDGRIKPDVVAPGQNIVSSYSSYYLENNPNANDINSDVRHFEYNGRTYAWNSNMGSSMSAPVVAGVIALWLQANPQLTPKDCIDIFSKTCTHYDASLTYPNNVYGYGQIDAEAGLRLILEKKTGIKTVHSEKTDGKIYTLDGRYVGGKRQDLPRGIYIIGNRKVLIK